MPTKIHNLCWSLFSTKLAKIMPKRPEKMYQVFLEVLKFRCNLRCYKGKFHAWQELYQPHPYLGICIEIAVQFPLLICPTCPLLKKAAPRDGPLLSGGNAAGVEWSRVEGAIYLPDGMVMSKIKCFKATLTVAFNSLQILSQPKNTTCTKLAKIQRPILM